MKLHTCWFNKESIFGNGAIRALKEIIERHHFRKAFLVTDNGVIATGIADRIKMVLDSIEMSYELFSDIQPNPRVKTVQSCLCHFEKSKADFIIALGGGSVIDTAKAVGMIYSNPIHHDVVSLAGNNCLPNPSISVIAIPTTAGTASEVTMNYVVTDEEKIEKIVCSDPGCIPMVAIIDPELMAKMPPELAAATGMDALTHAIEGYCTKDAWELTDILQLGAIQLIFQHLMLSVGGELRGREGMAIAQYIAGIGFSNTGLGIVHSMAHSLGALYDTPHGIANAVLLPYVLEYNLKELPQNKITGLARAMGAEESMHGIITAVRNLSKCIGLPSRLRELCIDKKDITKLSHIAFHDANTTGNPRSVTIDEIIEIFKNSY